VVLKAQDKDRLGEKELGGEGGTLRERMVLVNFWGGRVAGSFAGDGNQGKNIWEENEKWGKWIYLGMDHVITAMQALVKTISQYK